jgi:hypothetical protein
MTTSRCTVRVPDASPFTVTIRHAPGLPAEDLADLLDEAAELELRDRELPWGVYDPEVDLEHHFGA